MFQQFLQTEVLLNSVASYLIALGTIAVGIFLTKVLQIVIVNRAKRWARRTPTPLDDDLIRLVERFLLPLAYLGVLYLGIRNLQLHPILTQAIDVVSVLVLTITIIRFLGALVEYGIRFYLLTQPTENPALEVSVHALIPAIKVILWAIGFVFLLDNLGFDISAVIAGLGIGGVAVALASQGILQDLFSYFSILFDRPFELGDFIVVGDCIGSVEHVGIKTSRIRSVNGEEIIIANTDLTGSRIRNYKRMEKRRIVFTLGVTYETGLDKLQAIPGIIKTIIETTENVAFDRAHFVAYGDFSLNFEVVYFVLSREYLVYVDAQQHINLELKQAFEQAGIEFAYPTQVNYFTPTPHYHEAPSPVHRKEPDDRDDSQEVEDASEGESA